MTKACEKVKRNREVHIYKCVRCGTIVEGMSPQECRFTTGRLISHCGEVMRWIDKREE